MQRVSDVISFLIALATGSFLWAVDCGPGGVPSSFAGTLVSDIQLPGGRVYDLYIPVNYLGNKRPLVVVMHGFSGNKGFAQCTGIYEKADSKNFLVVSVQGLPVDAILFPGLSGETSWNVGSGPSSNENDVQYILDVINDVPNQGVKVNKKRIYAAGFSNGAGMAYQLAAVVPGIFAAVGVVGGTIGFDYRCDPLCYDITLPGTCSTGSAPPPPMCGYPWMGMACSHGEIHLPTGTITVAIVHGNLDDHLEADGTLGACDPGHDPYPLQDAVNLWVNQDGCTAVFHKNKNGIDRLRFANCLDHTNVLRYFIDSLHHEWPNRTIDTAAKVTVTDLLWDVFRRHHR